MKIVTVFFAVLMSVFSTSVISYVSLATPIGPWMGPTLALFAVVVCPFFFKSKQEMMLAVLAGSMGGIIATALSFSFPTLYFLDALYFDTLLTKPTSFLLFLGLFTFVAGFFGHACAIESKQELLENQQLAFPIGQLVFKLIDAGKNQEQTKQLFSGIITAVCYALFQTKIFFGKQIVPATVQLWNKTTIFYFTFPSLRFDLTTMPLFLSVGFLAGHLFAIPLLVGTGLKIFVADPVNLLWFQLNSNDFMFALCSGIVLSGAVSGLLVIGKQWATLLAKIKTKQPNTQSLKASFTVNRLFVGVIVIGLLSWCQFSLPAQLYIIIGTLLCTYQMAQIAGKIGLALLGRFATFVMIPGFLIFGFNPLQITVVSTLVELAGGVATETLFGFKTAELAGIDERKVYWYQLFGILVASITAAFVFYFLFSKFQLGSSQLFAQRAQSRALLVQAASFNYYVLALGVFCGMGLKRVKINPTLVLGGLLMPLSLSLSLIAGGLLSFMTENKADYEPFCSGVYATNALTILLNIFM